MSRLSQENNGVVLIVVLMLIVVIALWKLQESPEQAYERGKIDGQAIDTMETYLTMGLIPPSEIVRQVVDDDTLCFYRQRTDTGYVLKPIYIMRKPWTPYRPDWREEWLDTSRGWYGWEISEELARGWYDNNDSTHSVFDSTDTIQQRE